MLWGGNVGPGLGVPFERSNNDTNAGAGYVEFTGASSSVEETNSALTLSVRRVGGSNGLVQVSYATIDGSATAGADYVPQTGIVEFAAGDVSEKQITLSLLDNPLAEGDRSFVLALGQPLGGANWGDNAAITVVELNRFG